MADNNAKELAERSERLFAKKAPIDSLNQEIALHFYPERASFTTDRVWGEEFATHLFDSAPALARRDLCNMFASMLRPRGQPWFRATLGDDELMEKPAIQRKCDDITKTMRRQLYRQGTQFSRATKEADHDYGTFGNGILHLGINRGYDGLLLRCFHPRDCVWVEGPDGDIRDGGALWRKFKMSARNIVLEYPKAQLSEAVKNAADKDPDREFTLCHVMMPADEYYSSRRTPRGRMKWASVYYDHDNKTILKEEGSYEFRYIVPRWQTISGSPYAVSPAAITALPDGRGLQTMARVLLEAGEKSVDPPMKAVNEAVIGGINLFSGGTTWVEKDYDEREGSALEPILLGKQVAIGVELLMHCREKLKDCWYLTKLNLPQQGTRTAYEAARLVEEFVRANIPLFEPVETEYNGPLLDLAAQTLMRMGAFGDPREWPEELLQHGEVEFEFANPVQDAIEQNKANQASIVFGAAAAVSKIDPNALHVNDWSYILRDVTRGTGAPAKWSLDPDTAQANQQKAQQVGDILGGLNAAGQAADVVKTGTEAAANLHGMGLLGAPAAADQTAAYGPT